MLDHDGRDRVAVFVFAEFMPNQVVAAGGLTIGVFTRLGDAQGAKLIRVIDLHLEIESGAEASQPRPPRWRPCRSDER